jgi:hypothetical protein
MTSKQFQNKKKEKKRATTTFSKIHFSKQIKNNKTHHQFFHYTVFKFYLIGVLHTRLFLVFEPSFVSHTLRENLLFLSMIQMRTLIPKKHFHSAVVTNKAPPPPQLIATAAGVGVAPDEVVWSMWCQNHFPRLIDSNTFSVSRGPSLQTKRWWRRLMWVVGAVVEVPNKQRTKKAATKKAGLAGTRHL